MDNGQPASLTFRPLTADDLPIALPWFDDPETQRQLGGRNWLKNAVAMAHAPLGEFRGAKETGRYRWLALDGELPVGYIDCGAYELDQADDYPDFAAAVALVVAGGRARRGVLICGSGVGASVAANKIRGVRSALCHDTFSAHQGVEDDDMNVLALGARVIGPSLAVELVRTFLSAEFSGAERHRRRLEKVKRLETRTG